MGKIVRDYHPDFLDLVDEIARCALEAPPQNRPTEWFVKRLGEWVAEDERPLPARTTIVDIHKRIRERRNAV